MTEPAVEKLREYIEQGYCWICHKGGWRRLAKHTNKHDLTANDIREMAILKKRTPTCIKEESEIMSARTLRLIKEGKRRLPDGHLSNLVKHEYSQAGLIGMRENAAYMRTCITEEQKRKSIEASVKATSRPHLCPVCGTIVLHSKPICCSKQCRKIRQAKGLAIGRILYYTHPEYRLKMTEILNRVREKPKSHSCPKCGKLVIKSRPKYCQECSNYFNILPRDLIAQRYINGESRNNLANEYGISLTLVSLIKKHYLMQAIRSID